MSPLPPNTANPAPGPGEDQTPPPVHVYDGIEEHDNRLPNWWLGILYGSIVFAFGYWFVYQTVHARPGVWETYRAQADAAARRAAAAPLTDQSLRVMAADPGVLADGARLFQQTCAPCHGANAAGQVGPNLTDRFWLHGSAPTAIHKAITGGFPTKGMPPWGQMLGQTRVRTLAAYVLSVKGKNLPGKPPQGKEEH
jgi:cytochrome c oxidase cbb3-type subunit III